MRYRRLGFESFASLLVKHTIASFAIVHVEIRYSDPLCDPHIRAPCMSLGSLTGLQYSVCWSATQYALVSGWMQDNSLYSVDECDDG